MTENDFVLTVTKILPDNSKKRLYVSPKKKLVAKRKTNNIESPNLIYKFNTFDDYCNFIEFLVYDNLLDSNKIAQKIILYTYKNYYYLLFNDINTQYKNLSKFYTVITEFGSFVTDPNLFVNKLYESGTLFIKNNAIKKSINYFMLK